MPVTDQKFALKNDKKERNFISVHLRSKKNYD